MNFDEIVEVEIESGGTIYVGYENWLLITENNL
jgi:hypothetical protein